MLVKCVRGLGLQEDEREVGDVGDQRQEEVEELKELHCGGGGGGGNERRVGVWCGCGGCGDEEGFGGREVEELEDEVGVWRKS